jgi:hypothetical protein
MGCKGRRPGAGGCSHRRCTHADAVAHEDAGHRQPARAAPRYLNTPRQPDKKRVHYSRSPPRSPSASDALPTPPTSKRMHMASNVPATKGKGRE